MAVDKQNFLNRDLATGTLVRVAPTTTSVGAQPGDIIGLNSSGVIDPSLLPPGIVPVVFDIIASESLLAGDFVNVYATGTAKRVRKADASDPSKYANGFVLEDVSAGNTAKVYTDGLNTKINATGFLAGTDEGKPVFLSASVPGRCTLTRPTSSGNIIQLLGYVMAIDMTVSIDFIPEEPIEIE